MLRSRHREGNVSVMFTDSVQQQLSCLKASAPAESVRFGLHPRLTESWRGFYFYYPFAGQHVALHAWAEVAL